MSETTIPSGARCEQCGGDVQPQWRVCPMCGAGLAVLAVTVPPSMAPPSAVPPPSVQSGVAPPWPGNVVPVEVAAGKITPGFARPAQVEARQDRQWIGVGLLALGILGIIGGAVMLFQSSTIDALRFDSMLAYSTIGGGLMLLLVIVGLVVMAPRGGDSSTMTTHVVLSTTVSVLIGIAMAAVICVASVIYLFNDCVRGCQGQSRPATNYSPPANGADQLPPRAAPAPKAEQPAHQP